MQNVSEQGRQRETDVKRKESAQEGFRRGSSNKVEGGLGKEEERRRIKKNAEGKRTGKAKKERTR